MKVVSWSWLFIAVSSIFVGRVDAAPKVPPPPNAVQKVQAQVFTFDDLHRIGWKVDRPVYPATARAAKEQGTVYFEMLTDASGKIVRVNTPKKTRTPQLDAFIVGWAKERWHGPPASRAITFCTFRLP